MGKPPGFNKKNRVIDLPIQQRVTFDSANCGTPIALLGVQKGILVPLQKVSMILAKLLLLPTFRLG